MVGKAKYSKETSLKVNLSGLGESYPHSDSPQMKFIKVNRIIFAIQ